MVDFVNRIQKQRAAATSNWTFRPPDLAPQILSFHENKMIPKRVADPVELG
jgi:hypothetical protein